MCSKGCSLCSFQVFIQLHILMCDVRSQHQNSARLEPSHGCNPGSTQLQTLQQEINLHLLAMEKAPSPKKAQGASSDKKSKPQSPARKDSHIFWESAAVTNPRRGCLHPTRCLTHRLGFKNSPTLPEHLHIFQTGPQLVISNRQKYKCVSSDAFPTVCQREEELSSSI